MTLALLITCIKTPLSIVFMKHSSMVLNIIIDLIFLFDIFVIFNTAYYNQQYNLVHNRKTISTTYFKGFFFVDLVAIIPFELILSQGNINQLIRVTRINRLYKLAKLSQLLKFLKISKDKNKFMQIITKFLHISNGFERMFFFIVIMTLSIHLSACFWLFTATLGSTDPHSHEQLDHLKLEEFYNNTWLSNFDYEKMKDSDLYYLAIYWAVQTFTTVGYGDVSSVNSTERIFCAAMMVTGVLAFSFANGAFASIIQNYDL